MVSARGESRAASIAAQVLLVLLLCGAAWGGGVEAYFASDYINSYRAGDLVPVDVIIVNEEKDLSGLIEIHVRQVDGRSASPVYKVPFESPASSRKRFRAYCRIGQEADALAFSLRDDRGRLIRPRQRRQIASIPTRDLKVLALDERPEELGFLRRLAAHGENEGRRIHVEAFRGNALSLLPEHSACFEAFDLIFIGETDPRNFDERQRAMVRDYVARGGVLVLALGENAPLHEGAWTAQAAGVVVGERTVMSEAALADVVFDDGDSRGARQTSATTVTALRPLDESMLKVGEDVVLAAASKIGRGRMVALAVDPRSGALEECAGYQKMWADIFRGRLPRPALNPDGAATALADTVPQTAGVRIFPRALVFVYLGAYLLIGIVANGLFWTVRKQNEMAWYSLVAFSVLFTAFAVVFGTAGRAGKTHVHEFEVIRTAQDSPVLQHTTVMSILASGSQNFDFSLQPESAVVHEPTMQMPYYYRRESLRARPFGWVEAKEGRVEDLFIGASQLRVISVENEEPARGEFDVDVKWHVNGEISHCTIRNTTGYELQSAMLFVQGMGLELRKEEDVWRPRRKVSLANTPPGETDDYFLKGLLAAEGSQSNSYGPATYAMPPSRMSKSSQPTERWNGMLVGVVQGAGPSIAGPELEVRKTYRRRFLLAPVFADKAAWRPLRTVFYLSQGGDYGWQQPEPDFMYPRSPHTVEIDVPSDLALSSASKLELEVRVRSDVRAPPQLENLELQLGEETLTPRSAESSESLKVYEIPEWRRHLDEGRLFLTAQWRGDRMTRNVGFTAKAFVHREMRWSELWKSTEEGGRE